MSLLAKIRGADFLASEFLTWLWFRCEKQESLWHGPDGKSFELWPDDRLRIEAPVEGVTKNLLSGGTPTLSPEARAALAAGKVVQEARWKLIVAEREWLFTLVAPDLDLRSVKIPALLTEEEDDRLRERLTLIEQLEVVVEALFGHFLQLRLSGRWHREELPAMSRWIAAGVS